MGSVMTKIINNLDVNVAPKTVVVI